jgi:lysyl endopeptidase
MKKTVLSLWVLLLSSTLSFGQQTAQKGDLVQTQVVMDKNVPELYLAPPDLEQLRAEDEIRDRSGQFYRIGVAAFANASPDNSGLWKTMPNGDRMWQLRVKSPGAEALSFLFDVFVLNDNATFSVQDMNGVHRHRPMTREDNLDHRQQNAALCFGDEFVLTLIEPVGTRPSEILLGQVMYGYRSTGNPAFQKINESAACEVNVNCSPVGNEWQDEKRGVARILVVEGSQQGWCTGSLVNNTALNCRPYFLTALHCGVNATATNMNNWRFYFRYEAPTCTNPTTAGTLDDHFITGCVRIADSGDGGGTSGSDFLLVQLGSTANEATTITTLKSANFNAYWNGWDANNTTSNSGSSIHHPAGDIKKISTYSANLVNATWGGPAGTHWRVVWTANANGHGVTEGGSSGSPIFRGSTGNSLIMGTLTGGSSFCNAQSSPDLYGKMSYHWTSNGTANNRRLRPWLDAANTNALTLTGSSDPCSAPTVPVADFSANQTNVSPGTTVNFTDLTTGVPTSWSWSVSPATGWAYANGTTSATQNPQITFNTVGQYTIALTATNAQGSDTETKTNYITVAVATGPCTSTSTSCDEYIYNVTLNTINNTTACTNYGNYTGTSTTLNKGASYQVTVTPAVGTTVGQAYTNDEIAVWIDWNNDFDFNDAGEQVGYVIVAAGYNPSWNFTVPLTATTGSVRMRCRISYQPDDGAINPCGTTQWGEVEDYTLVLQDAPAGTLTLTCGPNQNILATTGGTTMPNLTSQASASTTCPGGVVTLSQSPAAGTPLQSGANNVTITATDACGNTQTCTVVVNYTNNLGIEENPFFAGVSVYPNPVSDELTVDLSALAQEDVTVEVYDLTGKLLVKGSNEGSALVQFNMSNFAKGLYHVRLTSGSQQTMRKVTKL